MASMKQERRSAFVLMPFDDEFQAIYHDLVVPALEEAGYEVSRADSFTDQRNILKDIVRAIQNAELIVVELTSLNANVMYELGIAHALGKPTVMLTQDMEEVPFDLRSYRIIGYSTRFNEVGQLKHKLTELAEKHVGGTVTFENPVTDFGSKISEPRMLQPREGVQCKELMESTGEDEPGILDFIVDSHQATEEITHKFEAISKLTRVVAEQFDAHQPELELLRDQKGGGSVLRRHAISKSIAAELQEYADELEPHLPEFHESWEKLGSNVTNLLSQAAIRSTEDRDALESLSSDVVGFKEVLKNNIRITRSTRQSLDSMRGISKELNRAVKGAGRVLDQLVQELVIGESYVSRIVTVIDEHLNVDRT